MWLKIKKQQRSFVGQLLLLVGVSGCVRNTELVFNDESAALKSQINYSVTLPMSKRTYVESVFLQVFSISETETDRQTLKTMIYDKKEFGGGCDPYGVSEKIVNGITVDEFARYRCTSGLLQDLKAASNPIRYAWTAKACETMILSRAPRFAAAMSKIIPGWTVGANLESSKPNADSIAKAYDLFFQGQSPDPEVVQALIELGNTVTEADSAWKLILTALCVSPEWQSIH